MQWHKRFEGVKEIYQRLEDEESKYLFEVKSRFLMDRDDVNIWEAIKEGKSWRCPNTEDGFIIFGTGITGQYYYDVLQRAGKTIKGFCDNYRKGELFGKTIWSVEDAVKLGGDICSTVR